MERGQLALRYRMQVPLCFYILIMHMLGTNAPRPPSSCIQHTHQTSVCTPLLKVMATGTWWYNFVQQVCLNLMTKITVNHSFAMSLNLCYYGNM